MNTDFANMIANPLLLYQTKVSALITGSSFINVSGQPITLESVKQVTIQKSSFLYNINNKGAAIGYGVTGTAVYLNIMDSYFSSISYPIIATLAALESENSLNLYLALQGSTFEKCTGNGKLIFF